MNNVFRKRQILHDPFCPYIAAGPVPAVQAVDADSGIGGIDKLVIPNVYPYMGHTRQIGRKEDEISRL